MIIGAVVRIQPLEPRKLGKVVVTVKKGKWKIEDGRWKRGGSRESELGSRKSGVGSNEENRKAGKEVQRASPRLAEALGVGGPFLLSCVPHESLSVSVISVSFEAPASMR